MALLTIHFYPISIESMMRQNNKLHKHQNMLGLPNLDDLAPGRPWALYTDATTGRRKSNIFT